MPGVRVEIVRYTSDWQPGFVECRFMDLGGRVWSFEEKAPIVTDESLGENTEYPRPGVIGCVVLERSEVGARVSIDHLCEGSEIFAESIECEVAASILVD